MANDELEREVSVDKSREEFEAWFKNQHSQTVSLWDVWQASRKAATPVAYLTHHGIAVSPDDFNGGADEMTLTARSEGWSPLIVGITVKGEGDDLISTPQHVLDEKWKNHFGGEEDASN